MLFIKTIRFILGYIKFEIKGGFVERFLNMCNLNNLKIWDITYGENSLTACTNIKSYKQMHRYAFRSGNTIKIKEKCGLPFITHRYKYRIGIVIGLVLFMVIIFTLTRFIWTVQVNGNEKIKDEIIIEYFEDLGLKQGAYLTQDKLREMEMQAMNDFQELSWIHINVFSSRAVIELRETVKMENKIDVTVPCNIISSFDGQIIKMSVREGYPQVKVGDSVVEGQLLISGINESEITKKVHYKHANAEITARTNREITAQIDRNEKYRDYTGKVKHRSYIIFFNVKIPLYIGGKLSEKNYEVKEKENHLKLWGTELPIYYYSVECKEYKQAIRELKDEELIKKCKKQIEKELKTIDRIEKINSISYEIDNQPYYCKITASIDCDENIVVQENIEVEESENVDK